MAVHSALPFELPTPRRGPDGTRTRNHSFSDEGTAICAAGIVGPVGFEPTTSRLRAGCSAY